MATQSQIDSLELSIIIPFLKVNPFDDYVVVDTTLKSTQSVSISDQVYLFTAYYRPSNTLVEITRHRVLRIS